MQDDRQARYYVGDFTVPETPAPGKPPEPWGKTNMIGAPMPRVDAYERVSGTAVYPSDLTLPGLLYGAILRCPHPHAEVKGMDTSLAENQFHCIFGGHMCHIVHPSDMAPALVALDATIHAPVPWRSGEAEDLVTGKRLSADTVSAAARAAVEKANPMSKNGYKVPLFRNLLEEELLAIASS